MENQENKIMKNYYELGESLTKFQSYIPIIQIDVDTALEMAETMNEHKKELFLGRQYMNLLSDLEKAGIIKLKDNVDDYVDD